MSSGIAIGLSEQLAKAAQKQIDLRSAPSPSPGMPTTTTTPKPANPGQSTGISAPGAGIAAGGVGAFKGGVPVSTGAVPQTNSDYFAKNWTSADHYAKSQQDRYNAAFTGGDADLMQRLEADAKRVGYTLTKPQVNNIGGNGITPPVPSSGANPSAGMSASAAQSQTTYMPSYTGPDLTGMTKQINDTYSNRLAAELQKLRDARDTAIQGYSAQEVQAKDLAYDNRNQSDTTNLQNEQRMKETMANAGLNTDGQNLSLQASQNAQRLGDLGAINRQETNALQDIGQKKSLLQNNAANNELALQQQIDSDKAAALFDLAKYGDTRAFDVDNANYGRYRDDVNQKFAEDQFGWSKGQDTIRNDAQYGGTYKGNLTADQRQQQIQNDAQYGGTYGTGQSLQGKAQDLANKNSNWSAYGDVVNWTQNLGKGPADNWSNLVNNANAGTKTAAGQQQDAANKQWQDSFDRSKYESDRDYRNKIQQQGISNGQWQQQFNQDVQKLGFQQASELWSQAFQENQAGQNDAYRKQTLEQDMTDKDRAAATQATTAIMNSGLVTTTNDPKTGKKSMNVNNPDSLSKYILALNLSDNATDALFYQYGLDSYVKK